MFPKDKDVEVPPLQVLIELGEEGRIRDIYSLVAKSFPEITEDELAENFFTGGNKWEAHIDGIITILVIKEEVVEPRLGVCAITDKGRKRACGNPF